MSRPFSFLPLTLLGSAATFLALSQLDVRGKRLAAARSELPTTLAQGVGPVVRRKVWAQVSGSVHSAQDTIQHTLQHFDDYEPTLLAWVFRRKPRSERLRQGDKLTIVLFLMRISKVKIEDVSPLSFTIRTLRQHPDAGTVKVSAQPFGGSGTLNPESHDFELVVESVVRSSNTFDRVAYVSGIKALQHSDWEIFLSHALEYVGGTVAQRDALVEEYPYNG